MIWTVVRILTVTGVEQALSLQGNHKHRITYVSEYPATEKGIMRLLKNQQLVDQILTLGAPFEVHAEFDEDLNTKSGYKWTSGKGPPVKIFPGTPCTARITVSAQRPATVVMPALKEIFD